MPLRRPLERFPYVPADPEVRDERCYEAYNIQVVGLAKRLEATGIEKVVIGVSGGLDSTQALIVACRTMDRLGLPRENVLAYTMPGFATTERTRGNAWALMKALGVTAEEIDIRPSARQMLEDLDHPVTRGEQVYDMTFENVQAGERTSHLFRLANHHGALVVGTGDLSELALGWTTYGVGDQMSHYNVNASVPKTLIQHLIRWVIDAARSPTRRARCCATSWRPRSRRSSCPPATRSRERPERGDGPAQRTEEVIGPYELQDFHLYFVSRYGFRPSKIAFLAHTAWGDARARQLAARLTKASATSTTCRRSSAGSASSSTGSSRPASSSARPCPTAPRSAPAAPSPPRRLARPERLRTPPSGSASSNGTSPAEAPLGRRTQPDGNACWAVPLVVRRRGDVCPINLLKLPLPACSPIGPEAIDQS